jgi:nucleoside-diphosphate-sugar epimerase
MHTLLGAKGTIAKVLAKELTFYSTQIRLVSRNPKKVNETDELFPADLTDPNQVDLAVAGSKVVYLLVGFDYNIKVWRKQWPALMKAVTNACIKHGARLVYFDNVYSYDINAIPHMTEEAPINPPSEKGKVRAEVLRIMFDHIQQGKLTGLVARAADFYGPENEKSFMIETVYKNLKKGKAAQWFADVNQIHTFTYTPDAAKATAILGHCPNDAWNQVWHLPTHPKSALTGRAWTALFAKEMGAKNKVSALPAWLISIIGWFVPIMAEMPEMMYQYDRPYVFDSSKFTARFGMEATTPEAAVKAIVQQG